MPHPPKLVALPGGGLAFYLDGNLQFDSRDEAIYHEAMVLPALALAAAGPLSVLIAGGGDGLALREVLKVERVARVDLVDYSAEMLEAARTTLAALNRQACADPRARLHHADIRAFVAQARAEGRRFDLIISDLTWPRDADDAELHTPGWYAELKALLAPAGLLAMNAASPGATPAAFWAMANGLRHAGLHVRPYRFMLPSFRALDYGPDWGMVLASPAPLPAERFADGLALAEPRAFLQDAAAVRRLFRFPAAHAAIAAETAPAADGQRLLALLRAPGQPPSALGEWDVLQADLAANTGPAPISDGVVPLPLRAALARAGEEREGLLQRVLALMPTLPQDPARAALDTFLEAPARFLAALDLPRLVDALLKRAAELPGRLTRELRQLKACLADPERLKPAALALTGRLLVVVSLVVILASLAHPDAVYGKGGGSAHGGISGLHSTLSHTSSLHHAALGTPHGVAQLHAAQRAPTLATAGGFRPSLLRRGIATDELGHTYPVQRYAYRRVYYAGNNHSAYGNATPHGSTSAGDSWQGDGELQVDYRLAQGIGLSTDGRIVVDLDQHAYFVLEQDAMHLHVLPGGEDVLALAPQVALYAQVNAELQRQHEGLLSSIEEKQAWIGWMDWLDFLPGAQEDRGELANLQTMAQRLVDARNRLGRAPKAGGPAPAGQVLCEGMVVLPNGEAVAVQTAAAGWRYLTPQRGWFADAALQTPVELPHGPGLGKALAGYLATAQAEPKATAASLDHAITAADKGLAEMKHDEQEYQRLRRAKGSAYLVDYGTDELRVDRAIPRLQQEIATAEKELADARHRSGEATREVERLQALADRFLGTR